MPVVIPSLHIDNTRRGLVLAWLPRVDGVVLKALPPHSSGKATSWTFHLLLVISFLFILAPSDALPCTGNCDDEGIMFSLSTTNLTCVPPLIVCNHAFQDRGFSRTSQDVHGYLQTFMLCDASDFDIRMLLHYYSESPRDGSPFDTGFNNTLSPQFERVAATRPLA